MIAVRLVCFLVAVTLLSVATSYAGVIQFTSRDAFQAATKAVTTMDFEGILPAGEDVQSYTGTPVRFSNVVYATEVFLVREGYTEDPYILSLGTGAAIADALGILATLPRAVSAVGFDARNPDPGSSLSLAFELSNGEQFSAALPHQPMFFGFISDTPFTTIALRVQPEGQDSFLALDNFSYGDASTIPEPNPAALVATFAVAVCWVGGKKFTAQ